MTRFGFKKLTQGNWLQPDPVFSLFKRMASDGTVQPIVGDDLVSRILEPKLAETVPDSVQALFEVARSVLAYGYFFYPLYMLGSEQLFRVAEAAVTDKCRVMGAPKSVRTFEQKVKYLINQRVIPEQERIRWDKIRVSRNIVSHPERQDIILPAMAIDVLERIADAINSLFPSPSVSAVQSENSEGDVR